MPRPILYWNKICPFVHRSWIAAIEKGVDFELVHVPLGDAKPTWYWEINPLGTVPCLKTEEGKLVFESLYIAQYFDERYGVKNALQPGDALTRYRSNLFIKASGDVVGALYGFLRSTPEDRVEKQREASAGLDSWEKAYASESEGPYFLGQTFSLADVNIVPFLDRFRYTLKAYKSYDIFEGRPRLARLMKEASLRPSLSQTMQPAAFYIESYRNYSKNPVEILTTLQLYGKRDCPFCKSVKIALRLSKLPYVDINIDNAADGYIERLNPKGEVPVLEIFPTGTVLTESGPIVSYIGDLSGNNGFLPAEDHQAAADSRFWINSFSDSRGDYGKARWGEGEVKAKAEKDMIDNLNYLETLLKKKASESGPYFLGAEPSLSDIITLPGLSDYRALYRSAGLAKHNGGAAFEASFPRISKLIDAGAALLEERAE